VRSIDEKGRGETAREYLARAVRSADILNRQADAHPDMIDNEDHELLATVNALVAIALVQVPEEPGSRLA
jgi:hypothetical protein